MIKKGTPQLIVLIIFLYLYPAKVFCQIDTVFWFAAPDVAADNEQFDRPIYLRISSLNQLAQIIISQPANTSFTPISILLPANSTKSFDLSAYLDNIECQYNEKGNKGIKVTASSPVTAYYDIVSGTCLCNPELFTLKGQNALGKLFYVPFQTLWSNAAEYSPSPHAACIIAATQNDTKITITPTTDLIDHPANVAFTITLNEGETYSATALGQTAEAHPSGSKIESNKPICVTMADDLVHYNGCADLIGDQIVPVDMLGSEYIVQRGFFTESEDEKIFVVATQNNTSIDVNGISGSKSINAGETTIIDLKNSNTYIKASSPIYVLHVSGYDCELGAALLPSINCRGSKEIPFVRATEKRICVTLVIKKGAEDAFLLDNKPNIINKDEFSVVPGTNDEYVGARIELSDYVTKDIVAKISNSKSFFQMGMINGDTRPGCSYGFFSNFAQFGSSRNVSICGDSYAILQPDNEANSYQWNYALQTSQSIIVNSEGIYWCTSSFEECSYTDTFKVNRLTLQLPDRLTLRCNTPDSLAASIGFDTYQWSPTNETSREIIVNKEGKYFVTASNEQCTLNDSCTVTNTCNSDLIAYYRFCGCSLNDFSGNKHDLSPGTTIPLCQKTIFNDGIMLGRNDVLEPSKLSSFYTNFSFSTWLRLTEANNSSLFSQDFPLGSFSLTFDKTQINFNISYNNSDVDLTEKFSYQSDTSFNNRYLFFNLTYDDALNQLSFYVNNKKVASFTPQHHLQAFGSGFTMGHDYRNDYFFNGVIDETRLFSRVISDHEIDSLYALAQTTFNVGKDIQALAGQTVTLKLPDGFTDYTWSSASAVLSHNQSLITTTNGMYIASALDADACQYTDTIKVNFQTSGTPFNCNGISYVSAGKSDGVSTEIYNVVVDDNLSATFAPIGFTAPTDFNAIGFNPVDGCIYAFDRTNFEILRIFSNQTYTSIGLPEELKNIDFYMGDCDENGNYIIVDGNGNVSVIDVSQLYPKVIRSYKIDRIVSSGMWNNTADIAISPSNGCIYFFTNDSRKLNKYNPTDQSLQEINAGFAQYIYHLGALWFDAKGNLYGYGNQPNQDGQNNLFSLDAQTGEDHVLGTGPNSFSIDGCACAYYVDLYKTASLHEIAEGDTCSYLYTISNATRAIQTGYTFIDTLPQGISIESAPTQLLSATLNITTLNNRSILTAKNISIPQHETRFRICVRAACLTADKTIISQAHIPDLPERIGGPLKSDDSSTARLNDPTRITILQNPQSSIDALPAVCKYNAFTFKASGADPLIQRWETPDKTKISGNEYNCQSASMAMSGTYLLITDYPQCPDTIKHKFTVNPQPNVTMGFDKTEICEKQTLTLYGKNAKTYQWNDAAVTNNIPFAPTQNKTYIVIGTDKNGCSDTAQIDIRVYPVPSTNIQVSDADRTVCPGTIVDLSVPDNFKNYQWSTGETSNAIHPRITANTTYNLTISDSHCSNTVSIDILVAQRKNILSQSSSRTLCQDVDTMTITLRGENLQWFTDSTQNPVADSASYLFTLSKSQPTQTMYVRETDTYGCISHFATITVSRNLGQSLVSLSGREFRCADKKSEETFTLNHLVELDSVAWNPSCIYSKNTNEPPSIIVPYLGVGVDTIKVFARDVFGCRYSLSKAIHTIASPRADFDWTADNAEMSAQFSNTSDSSLFPLSKYKLPNTYHWTFWKHDSLWKQILCRDTTLRYPYGFHKVSLLAVNQYNCADSITKVIFIDVHDALYVPNACMPDHPSVELSHFLPRGMSLQLYEISIYDQWGNLLWFSNKLMGGQPAEAWNGMYNGAPVKSDIYIWKIKAQFIDGQWWRNSSDDKPVFGNLILLR